jgi:hypothetical protein
MTPGAGEAGGPRPESVTVVVGASVPGASLEACLEALAPQIDDEVEVLVCEAQPAPSHLRDRFGWATFIEVTGALVPELWREGIDRARGDIVALTIAQMEPAENWIAAIRDEQSRVPIVGGAIEPGRRLRLRDWGEYFCRYARDMLPFEGRRNVDLPGDNAAYRRELIQRHSELYRDGFWEPVVHHHLAGEGVVCWHSPALVVRQGRSFGWRAFVRQRLAHGRKYGHQRGANFSQTRNLVGVLGSPLVPFLMTYRVLHQVMSKRSRRLRALAALPVIFSFNLAWAGAEALGHLDMVFRR